MKAEANARGPALLAIVQFGVVGFASSLPAYSLMRVCQLATRDAASSTQSYVPRLCLALFIGGLVSFVFTLTNAKRLVREGRVVRIVAVVSLALSALQIVLVP